MVLGIIVAVTFLSILISANQSFAQSHTCDGHDATIVGTEEKDRLMGTRGNDVIVGLGGDDKIFGMGGDDIICGGDGDDKIYGNRGNDILIGASGADKISGGWGVDTCDVMGDDKRAKQCEIQYQEKNDDTGNSDDTQNQLEELQKKIDELTKQVTELFGFWSEMDQIPEDFVDGDDDTLQTLDCTEGQLVKKNGEGWECTNSDSSAPITNSNPIFFHFSTIEGGITEWVGVSTKVTSESDSDRPALVIPSPGKITNLMVLTGKSGDMPNPGEGRSFTMTVIKNDSEETVLTCSIQNQESECSDTKSEVKVDAGDTIVLRVEASPGANSAVIRSSIVYTS